VAVCLRCGLDQACLRCGLEQACLRCGLEQACLRCGLEQACLRCGPGFWVYVDSWVHQRATACRRLLRGMRGPDAHMEAVASPF
jgi:hypothetical protein